MKGTLLKTRKGWIVLYQESDKVLELFVHPSLIIKVELQAEVEFKIVKSKSISYAVVVKYEEESSK